MLIKNLTAEKYTLKLREPFSYHTLTLDSLAYVLIKATSSTGLVGIGEAALAWDVTGETQEGALSVSKLIAPLVVGAKINSVDDVQKTMNAIGACLAGNTGLKTAVESALFDVLGQAKKKPVFVLLGGKKKPFIILQKTFSFEELRDDIEPVMRAALRQGVRVFKCKVGGDRRVEVSVLRKIHKMFPKVTLVLDANQAWDSPASALGFLRELGRVRIGWLEQPLATRDFDGLAAIRRRTLTPIMADESCHTSWHLKLLYEKRAIDLVNIKLSKCGGLLEAQRMIKYCQKHKIGYMLGDMLHSDVGTAYNLHAACLGDFISYDLTLPERLRLPRGKGLHWDGYKVAVPTTPGLGVTI